MELENYKADEQCLACNEARDGYVCYHHMVTQKNLGPDEKWNLMPLCSKHHTSGIHVKGTMFYSENFPRVKEWLIKNGWEICQIRNKWFHPKEATSEQKYSKRQNFRGENSGVLAEEGAISAP